MQRDTSSAEVRNGSYEKRINKDKKREHKNWLYIPTVIKGALLKNICTVAPVPNRSGGSCMKEFAAPETPTPRNTAQ